MCSHDAKHLHEKGRRDVADEHRCHEDAQAAAEEHADDAVELPEELWADKLRL